MTSDYPALRLGFVGTETPAVEVMNGALKVVPDVEAAAIYAPQVARYFERVYGIRPVGSIKELAETADLFMITGPLAEQPERVTEIIAHRPQSPTVILIQPPGAVDPRAVVSMRSLATGHGAAVIAVCLDRRQSAVQWLAGKVRHQGLIGEVYRAECTFDHSDGWDEAWWLNRELGGGVGMEHLPHLFDLVLFTLGFPEILGVSANVHGLMVPASATVEDTIEGMFTYRIADSPNPGTVRFKASWIAPTRHLSMLVQGTEGWASLRWPRHRPHETLQPHLHRIDHAEQRGPLLWLWHPAQAPSLAQCQAAQLRAAADAWRTLARGEIVTGSPLVTLDDALQGLLIIRAAYRSAELGGAQQSLPDVPG